MDLFCSDVHSIVCRNIGEVSVSLLQTSWNLPSAIQHHWLEVLKDIRLVQVLFQQSQRFL